MTELVVIDLYLNISTLDIDDEHIENIEVYGSWDNWKTPIIAQIVSNNYYKHMHIWAHVDIEVDSNSSHQYKWKVVADGITNWYCDNINLSIYNDGWNCNNILFPSFRQDPLEPN